MAAKYKARQSTNPHFAQVVGFALENGKESIRNFFMELVMELCQERGPFYKFLGNLQPVIKGYKGDLKTVSQFNTFLQDLEAKMSLPKHFHNVLRKATFYPIIIDGIKEGSLDW